MSIPVLDEATVEAFLSGRAPRGDLPRGLVAFADDLQIATRGPAPRPNVDLAPLLAQGLSIERVHVTTPPARRRRPYARLVAFGLAAKVVLGLGVAAAGVTGAGAAGVLPAPVQEAVATAVDSVTPFHFPHKPAVHSDRGDPGASDGTPAARNSPPSVPVGPEEILGNPGSAPAGHGVTPTIPAAGGQPPASVPPAPTGGGGGAAPGPTGLDKANTTPAAGHVPTSVPAPSSGNGAAGTGLETAGSTPATGRVPSSVPGPPAIPPGRNS